MHVFNLVEHVEQGKLSSSILLETSRYLGSESLSSVVTQWVRALLNFKNGLYLAENTYLFDKYLKQLLLPHIKRVQSHEFDELEGWNEKAYYQYLFYFGVKWRHAPAMARAKSVVKQFFRGEHVDAIYLSFALSYYRRKSSRWMKTLKMLETYPRSIQEYSVILSSLCKTRKPRQQLYILRYSRRCDNMPRSLKKKTVCYVSRRNPTLAWSFFKQHYHYYFALYGEAQFSFGGLLECVTAGLNTQQQYNDVRAFFAKNSAGTGEAGLKRGLESISGNIQQDQNSASGTENRSEDTDEILANFVKGIDESEITGEEIEKKKDSGEVDNKKENKV